MQVQKTKLLFIIALIFQTLTLFSQSKNQTYLNYIQSYSNLALLQQKEYGIPASITLAQGLLESGAGQSEFAKNSNNHFGIKCHDWTGEKLYHDDDARGECFRKYKDVLESYEDHSKFLKNKSRYAFLFEFSATDYEKWAHGLKKAGYATDPTYAYKLISLIENYDLHKYDLASYSPSIAADKNKNHNTFADNSMGSINAFQTHDVYKNNRVKFIVLTKYDSFTSISDEFNISIKRLLKYNEINEFTVLKPGSTFYLSYKKSKAARGNTVHVVRAGDSMYNISQQYAIKIEKLYKMNHMPYSEGPKLGQVLKLR